MHPKANRWKVVGMHEFFMDNAVALHNAYEQRYSRVRRMTAYWFPDYDQCCHAVDRDSDYAKRYFEGIGSSS